MAIAPVDPSRPQPHQLGVDMDTTYMDPPDLPAVAVLVNHGDIHLPAKGKGSQRLLGTLSVRLPGFRGVDLG